MCGQILSILIQNEKKIKGIKVGNDEYKLTQFADDTTLLMDGSQDSLQTALNILEIFGSMSGLKINTQKTKLIWIGRKKHCKDKLCVNLMLEWGITEFVLLGITFDVKLENMLTKNFNNALQQSKVVLNNWKRRYLTPFGKIAVIKTFIISKFNHLFLSLPNPTYNMIKSLTDLIYDFLWDGKPDKVSRNKFVKNTLREGSK